MPKVLVLMLVVLVLVSCGGADGAGRVVCPGGTHYYQVLDREYLVYMVGPAARDVGVWVPIHKHRWENQGCVFVPEVLQDEH